MNATLTIVGLCMIVCTFLSLALFRGARQIEQQQAEVEREGGGFRHELTDTTGLDCNNG